MFKNFFHIANPNRSHVKAVRKFFSQNPSLEVMWVERQSHPTHLETLVQWAYNEGRHKIAVWGGDGTLSRVVNTIMELKALQKMEVALIPVGTCNDFARKMELPHWQKWAQMGLTGKPHDEGIDAGLLTTPIGKRAFVNNAGFGRTRSNVHGIKSGRSNPIKDILSFKPKQMDLDWELNGEHQFETRAVLLGVVCNAPYFNKAMYFDRNVEPNDGVLNAFLETPQSKFNLLFKFLKSRFGASLLDQHTMRIDGRVIRLESRKDVFPQVDGEAAVSAPVRSLEFSLLPHKLRFCRWN